MKLSRYAPSAQFLVIVGSLLISGGLIYGAKLITSRPAPSATIASDQTIQDDSWEATLYAIQAQNASTSIIAPDKTVVEQFLQAAKSSNVTDTVARTLFINLSNAKAQGLGDDVPTQDQIVSAAMGQIKSTQSSVKTYTTADITIVPNTESNLRAYGNAVMKALASHPEASERATLLAIDYAVEGGDKTQGAKLKAIGAAYKADGEDLLKVPVPQTLAPLHLSAINTLLQISATYNDMQVISTDSIRGLAGLRSYDTLMDASARLFTNIAQQLNKNGILFTKDEPGSAWNVLLAPSSVPTSP